eukprot:scaffold4386_cov105-Isochrysis_galbana.AAC.2
MIETTAAHNPCGTQRTIYCCRLRLPTADKHQLCVVTDTITIAMAQQQDSKSLQEQASKPQKVATSMNAVATLALSRCRALVRALHI